MDEPVLLPIGTAVSARYRGAFCEAKIIKVAKCIKCKVTYKDSGINSEVSDDDIRGVLKVGGSVEVKKLSTGQYHEATVQRITDTSSYTVVFDDGDQTTLKRSRFCLKGKRHFTQSETLDQLPLTNPEQFGTPVARDRRGATEEDRGGRLSGKKRTRPAESSQSSGGSEDEEEEEDGDGDGEEEEQSAAGKRQYTSRLSEMVGRIVVMEIEDRKKTAWLPVLVVQPSADNLLLPTRDHLLVRSFKDSKYYAVARKDTKEFTRDMALKNEDKTLKATFDKSLVYVDTKELPQGWVRDHLLGRQPKLSEQQSDDAPNEEKDMFVALLYKFMDDCGTPLNKAPTILGRDLDLFRLFRIVKDLGGYNRVTNQQKWHIVYSKMALPMSTNSANQIKAAYKKFLHSFEDFYRKLGSTMGNTAGKGRNTPGRSLLPRRERDIFPKSPVNPALKKSTKDDDKDDRLEAEEDKAETDKMDSISVTVGATRSVEVVRNKDKETPRTAPPASGKDEPATGRVAKKTPRGKVVAASSSADEDDKPTPKPIADLTDGRREAPRSATKMRRRQGDSEVEEEVDRKRRRRGDSECTAGDDARGDKTDGDDSESHDQVCVLPHYPIGTRLKVRYKTAKDVYEAKVTKVREGADGQVEYHVHYAGWNNRYDEWVSAEHVEGPSGIELVTSGVKGGNVKDKAPPSSVLSTRSSNVKDGRSAGGRQQAVDTASPGNKTNRQRITNGKYVVRLKRLSSSSVGATATDDDAAIEMGEDTDVKHALPDEEEPVAGTSVVLRGRKDSNAMPQLTKEEPNSSVSLVKTESDLEGPDRATESSSTLAQQRLSVDTVCGDGLPALDTPLSSSELHDIGSSLSDRKGKVIVENADDVLSTDAENRNDEDDEKPTSTAGGGRKKSRRRKQSERVQAESTMDSMDVLAVVAASAACASDVSPSVTASHSEIVRGKGKVGGRPSAKVAKVEVVTDGMDSGEKSKTNAEGNLSFLAGVSGLQNLAACSSGEHSRDEACSTKSEHEANVEVEALLRAAALRDTNCDSPTALEDVSNGSGCNNGDAGAGESSHTYKRNHNGSSNNKHHLRRRRRRVNDRTRAAKSTPKRHGSDSDDCDDPRSPGTLMKLASISPRPAKFNFVQCLDNLMPLTPERRIELIMTQIGEMKKMYTQLKSKVSAIERLRKRHRREREAAEKSFTEAASP